MEIRFSNPKEENFIKHMRIQCMKIFRSLRILEEQYQLSTKDVTFLSPLEMLQNSRALFSAFSAIVSDLNEYCEFIGISDVGNCMVKIFLQMTNTIEQMLKGYLLISQKEQKQYWQKVLFEKFNKVGYQQCVTKYYKQKENNKWIANQLNQQIHRIQETSNKQSKIMENLREMNQMLLKIQPSGSQQVLQALNKKIQRKNQNLQTFIKTRQKSFNNKEDIKAIKIEDSGPKIEAIIQRLYEIINQFLKKKEKQRVDEMVDAESQCELLQSIIIRQDEQKNIKFDLMAKQLEETSLQLDIQKQKNRLQDNLLREKLIVHEKQIIELKTKIKLVERKKQQSLVRNVKLVNALTQTKQQDKGDEVAKIVSENKLRSGISRKKTRYKKRTYEKHQGRPSLSIQNTFEKDGMESGTDYVVGDVNIIKQNTENEEIGEKKSDRNNEVSVRSRVSNLSKVSKLGNKSKLGKSVSVNENSSENSSHFQFNSETDQQLNKLNKLKGENIKSKFLSKKTFSNQSFYLSPNIAQFEKEYIPIQIIPPIDKKLSQKYNSQLQLQKTVEICILPSVIEENTYLMKHKPKKKLGSSLINTKKHSILGQNERREKHQSTIYGQHEEVFQDKLLTLEGQRFEKGSKSLYSNTYENNNFMLEGKRRVKSKQPEENIVFSKADLQNLFIEEKKAKDFQFLNYNMGTYRKKFQPFDLKKISRNLKKVPFEKNFTYQKVKTQNEFDRMISEIMKHLSTMKRSNIKNYNNIRNFLRFPHSAIHKNSDANWERLGKLEYELNILQMKKIVNRLNKVHENCGRQKKEIFCHHLISFFYKIGIKFQE